MYANESRFGAFHTPNGVGDEKPKSTDTNTLSHEKQGHKATLYNVVARLGLAGLLALAQPDQAIADSKSRSSNSDSAQQEFSVLENPKIKFEMARELVSLTDAISLQIEYFAPEIYECTNGDCMRFLTYAYDFGVYNGLLEKNKLPTDKGEFIKYFLSTISESSRIVKDVKLGVRASAVSGVALPGTEIKRLLELINILHERLRKLMILFDAFRSSDKHPTSVNNL